MTQKFRYLEYKVECIVTVLAFLVMPETDHASAYAAAVVLVETTNRDYGQGTVMVVHATDLVLIPEPA